MTATAVLQSHGGFKNEVFSFCVFFMYIYYVNYDDCGTAVAAFEILITCKWPGILKFSHFFFHIQKEGEKVMKG